ncbi:hypothetical protein T03_13608 [Trichinella britovi]|uniref:Uncharacterized protein n=2 Tax=Trichinella TaxID=6333 RepID=A0A0V1CUP9_TRIBR|nr:hypothetical protein T03_13608 [Trichinella britovi]
MSGFSQHADVVGTGIPANADGELIDLSEDSSAWRSVESNVDAMAEMEEQNYSVSEHRVGSTEELPNGYSGHIVILTAKKDLRARRYYCFVVNLEMNFMCDLNFTRSCLLASLAPEDFEELRRITFPVLQRA